jgi:transcriptional regulator with XRE-family HTH domain
MVITNRTSRKRRVRFYVTRGDLDSGIDWTSVAARIAEAREAKGLTQAELASAIGYSRGQVNRLESGGMIELRTLELIAGQISRSVKWLLFGDVIPMDVEAIITRAKAEAFEEAGRAMIDLSQRTLQLRGTAIGSLPRAFGDLTILPPQQPVESAEENAALNDATEVALTEIERLDQEGSDTRSRVSPTRRSRRKPGDREK